MSTRIPKQRAVMFAGILVVAVVALVTAVLVSQAGSEPDTAPHERVALLDGIPQSGTRLGRIGAPVVVEEYADMQCPFCARFATGELPAIVEDYVRPGNVQLDFKVLTFLGPDSVRGGRFVVAAAAQNRLWQATEAFFSNQGEENAGYVTDQFLRTVADKAGIDADRAFADQRTGGVSHLLSEARAAAKHARIQGTPSFVVRRGGEARLVSADELRGAIDEALER